LVVSPILDWISPTAVIRHAVKIACVARESSHSLRCLDRDHAMGNAVKDQNCGDRHALDELEIRD
jgi:hypothetical protein